MKAIVYDGIQKVQCKEVKKFKEGENAAVLGCETVGVIVL